MYTNPIPANESSIRVDYRGCATADKLYLHEQDAWLELDSFDHRSKGFDSLALDRAWDYYGQDESSCNVFDAQGRHIGAAWVEAAQANHPSGESYVLIYLGFRTDIPWVKCPKFLNKVYAIAVRDFPGYFPLEIVDGFVERLWDATREEYERGLTPAES